MIDDTSTNSTASMPIVVGHHSIEKLEGVSNYNNWKFSMKTTMIVDGLWECVTGNVKDTSKDQRALEKICLNVLPAVGTRVG
jgi:hypothetical protein